MKNNENQQEKEEGENELNRMTGREKKKQPATSEKYRT